MKDTNIKTRYQEVTPQWAEKKLAELQKLVDEGTFRNRNINKDLVNTYASDMARGRWGITHQGLAFDEYGRLLDGQHRLWAVIKAGIPVVMAVTTGVPATTNGKMDLPTMDLLDRGKVRSIGQQLHIAHGVVGAGQVAATIRSIAYVYTNDSGIKLSITQTVELINMYDRDIQAIFNRTTHTRQRVGPVCGPMAVYRSVSPDKADEFATGYFTKESLAKGSPILALIKWVELHPGYGGKEVVFQKLKAVAYALHQHHHGLEVEAIKTTDEALYWLSAMNKQHGEVIRKMIYPLRKA